MEHNVKKNLREFEKLTYSRDMFWHESEKQYLIKRLLQKIYDLEDEVEKLKNVI